MKNRKKNVVFISAIALSACNGTGSTEPGGIEAVGISDEVKNCIAIGGYSLKKGDEITLGAFLDGKINSVSDASGSGGFTYTNEDIEELEGNLILDKLDTETLKSKYLDKIFECAGGEKEVVSS